MKKVLILLSLFVFNILTKENDRPAFANNTNKIITIFYDYRKGPNVGYNNNAVLKIGPYSKEFLDEYNIKNVRFKVEGKRSTATIWKNGAPTGYSWGVFIKQKIEDDLECYAFYLVGKGKSKSLAQNCYDNQQLWNKCWEELSKYDFESLRWTGQAVCY